MLIPNTIGDYLRTYSAELGERVIQSYPALHQVDQPLSPRLSTLLRKPFPAQSLAIMGVVKRWQEARSAAIVAECGTGKTLISLASMHVHSDGKPYTAIAMVPPHLVEKWCREALNTLPGIRVFIVDGIRDGARKDAPQGVNEVRFRHGHLRREGLHATLTDLRLRKGFHSARQRWNQTICSGPALFVIGRDKGKLGWFWRHSYITGRSGRYVGNVINPDTGSPIYTAEDQLRVEDFRKVRLGETIGIAETVDVKARRAMFSPLWQADGKRIRRVAPVEFIGRYMDGWFDYALCDEAHQLAGDTAQGNGLGTLAACSDKIAVLTGTLLGGFADDLYNLLFRLDPAKMISLGYQWGQAGVRSFAETYGVLETVTTIEPAENACSKARTTKQVKRKPGASARLFGDFLMEVGAFVSLEDISSELPPYTEEVVGIPMDVPLHCAYQKLEDDIKAAIREHPGNHSVISVGMNALLLYPDRPFELGRLIGYEYNPETRQRESFVISDPADLDESMIYAKERQLVEEVKSEVARGNRCHVYAVYTRKRDVTRRIESILKADGIRTAILTADVPTDKREAWFAKRLDERVQVTISHPKIIETGIDLISHNCLIFYETGYSLHTLRQASRRSWRIGQRRPVRVLYLHYEDTMQTACLRLMGKKLLVSLAMEGKFSTDGLQALGDDDDILTAMARELVNRGGIGESADAIWRQVHQQTAFISSAAALNTASTTLEALPAYSETKASHIVSTSGLIFGSKPATDSSPRKPLPRRLPDQDQLPLF